MAKDTEAPLPGEELPHKRDERIARIRATNPAEIERDEPGARGAAYIAEMVREAPTVTGKGGGGSSKGVRSKKRGIEICPTCNIELKACGCDRRPKRGRPKLGRTRVLKLYMGACERTFLRELKLTLPDVLAVILDSPAMSCWRSHVSSGPTLPSNFQRALDESACTCESCSAAQKPNCVCWRCSPGHTWDGADDYCSCSRCALAAEDCNCWRCAPLKSAYYVALQRRSRALGIPREAALGIRSPCPPEWLEHIRATTERETKVRLQPEQFAKFESIGKRAPRSQYGSSPRYSHKKFAEYCIRYFADLVLVSQSESINAWPHHMDKDDLPKLQALATRCYRCNVNGHTTWIRTIYQSYRR